MKNKYFWKVGLLAITTIALSSCATMKIKYYGEKVPTVQNAALISTMIGQIQQPIFPLIDAGIFNSITNGIADQIMDLQKQNVDKCRNIIGKSIQKNLNCKVIYADSLNFLPAFEEMKSKYHYKNSLKLENDNYPMIILAKDDINPFKFIDGKVFSYFKTDLYKEPLADIAQKLNLDLIAVSYSTLSVVNVGTFGIYGNLRLDTYLFLFDKDGNKISDAHTWSTPTNISGGKIRDYMQQLDNLSLIFEPMMLKIGEHFQGK